MEVSQNEAISEGVKVWVVAVSCLRQGKQSARLSTVRFVGGEPPIPPLFFSAHTQPGPPQNLRWSKQRIGPKKFARPAAEIKPPKDRVIFLRLVPNIGLDITAPSRVLLVVKKGGSTMPQKRLTTNGNVFRRTDGRWQSVIWYFDEQGVKRRKVFSSKTKTEAQQKITTYIAQFNAEVRSSDESQKTIKDSLTRWLQVFKFPSVERTTYDRLECTAQHQVFPLIGEKIVGDITAADLKSVLNHWMEQGYAYTTVKKVHILLNEYFRYLTEEDFIQKNPMQSVSMMKKANFLAAQDKEYVPEQESVSVFTPAEIAKFKREAFATFANGKRKYQQAAAYILMLNTGLRTGELLGLLNSDIDLERRVLHLERGVKEVWRRDGLQAESGRDVKVGKLKSATSKRTVPLNDTAVAMIRDLRKEAYFGEDAPLVPDEHGDYTRPVNFRKRYYRILAAAGIEKKGLHSLRHTFASSLVNGIKQEDGTIKSLTPRQVADLLGHSTSQITELYYVKKDTSRLHGITDDFNL